MLWEKHYQGKNPQDDEQPIQTTASILDIPESAVAAAVRAVKGLRESHRETGTSEQLRHVCAEYFGE